MVDDDSGQIMSSIIRAFLLGPLSPQPFDTLSVNVLPGSSYIFRHKQLLDAHAHHRSSRTDQAISRARTQSSRPSSLASSPRILRSPLKDRGSPMSETSGFWMGRRHVVEHDWGSIRDALHVAKNEHVSSVDICVSLASPFIQVDSD